MAVPDFGTDLSCTDDLDPTGREVSGLELVSQAAHRRLVTRRGQLIDDQDYGDSVIDALGTELTQVEVAALPARIRTEIEKDECVESATTQTTIDASGAITVIVSGVTALGPFEFTLPIGSVTSDVIG